MCRSRTLAISLTLLASGLSGSVFAAESDDWQFEVTPHLFAAALDGTTGIRGVESDLDVSFSDTLEVLEFAFMGVFTAQKGPWSYGVEAWYIKLDDQGATNVTGPFGNVTVNAALEVETELSVYQGSVGYRVVDNRIKADFIGALRYTKITLDATAVITTTPSIVFPGGARSAEGSEEWVDGVIGMRLLYPLNEEWSLLGYADVGAGGSDLTYQLIAGANWQFSDGVTAKLGYRVLDWDYENDGNVWDMTMSGPYLGVGIRF